MSADTNNENLLARKELVEETLAGGFSRLRFPRVLENNYQIHRHSRLVPRSVTVGWYALAIHLAYCFSDYLLLPESVFYTTIAIRVFIILPFVAFVVWASRFEWQPRNYVYLYLSAYMVCGLAVIGIILVGRLQDVPIPYEGFLLVMMFGYFVTGLPFYSMVAASMFMFVCYVLTEWYAGYPIDGLTYNAFFILTANVIGAVGNYIQEHTQRSNYLNQSLVEMSRDQAEDKSESKTMLLATASHDLRQPLHAMNLFAENLMASLPPGSSKETAEKLQHSINHLNRLLSALLDYSRLHAGVVEPKVSKVDLLEIISQIRNDVEQKPDAPKVIANVSLNDKGTSCFVESDGILLARVLRNICNNVLEHAQATELGIEVADFGKRLVVKIRDNGKGMSASELDSMYDEFYQGEGGSGAGMGLGLAIVKQSVDLLGIPLEVNSNPGHGTTFSLVLDRAETKAFGVESDAWIDDIAGKTILVVEDLPEILESTADLFTSWGCHTLCAGNIERALELVAANEVDLVVTDYHLGKHDTGLDFIEQVRNDKQLKLPAIIVTADIHVQLEDDEQTYVVHKPVRPAKYRMMLNQLLA